MERLPLYAEPGHPEAMHLLRLAPGVALPTVELAGGEELFVLGGAFEDEHGAHREGTWLRYPAGARHTPRTAGGCDLYVKKGHLAAPHPGRM